MLAFHVCRWLTCILYDVDSINCIDHRTVPSTLAFQVIDHAYQLCDTSRVMWWRFFGTMVCRSDPLRATRYPLPLLPVSLVKFNDVYKHIRVQLALRVQGGLPLLLQQS